MERLRVPASGVEELVRGLRPSSSRREDVRSTVADIVDMVRSGGDDAVRRLTLRLDEVDVPGPRVSPAALNAALVQLDPEVRSALELLAENVRAVAAEMVPRPARVELAQGQVVSTRQVPVRRAGVYVPGGLAAYPSSAVMAIVPAQVAGVPGSAACSARWASSRWPGRASSSSLRTRPPRPSRRRGTFAPRSSTGPARSRCSCRPIPTS